MKFKVGDRIQIVKINCITDVSEISPDYLIGKTGEIIDVWAETDKYPYEIKFDDKVAEASGNNSWAEDELDFEDIRNVYLKAMEWFKNKTGYDVMDLIDNETIRNEFYDRITLK